MLIRHFIHYERDLWLLFSIVLFGSIRWRIHWEYVEELFYFQKKREIGRGEKSKRNWVTEHVLILFFLHSVLFSARNRTKEFQTASKKWGKYKGKNGKQNNITENIRSHWSRLNLIIETEQSIFCVHCSFSNVCVCG